MVILPFAKSKKFQAGHGNTAVGMTEKNTKKPSR
jgi:hypothetical protein